MSSNDAVLRLLHQQLVLRRRHSELLGGYIDLKLKYQQREWEIWKNDVAIKEWRHKMCEEFESQAYGGPIPTRLEQLKQAEAVTAAVPASAAGSAPDKKSKRRKKSKGTEGTEKTEVVAAPTTEGGKRRVKKPQRFDGSGSDGDEPDAVVEPVHATRKMSSMHKLTGSAHAMKRSQQRRQVSPQRREHGPSSRRRSHAEDDTENEDGTATGKRWRPTRQPFTQEQLTEYIEQRRAVAACVTDDNAPYLSGCRHEHWLVGIIVDFDLEHDRYTIEENGTETRWDCQHGNAILFPSYTESMHFHIDEMVLAQQMDAETNTWSSTLYPAMVVEVPADDQGSIRLMYRKDKTTALVSCSHVAKMTRKLRSKGTYYRKSEHPATDTAGAATTTASVTGKRRHSSQDPEIHLSDDLQAETGGRLYGGFDAEDLPIKGREDEYNSEVSDLGSMDLSLGLLDGIVDGALTSATLSANTSPKREMLFENVNDILDDEDMDLNGNDLNDINLDDVVSAANAGDAQRSQPETLPDPQL